MTLDLDFDEKSTILVHLDQTWEFLTKFHQNWTTIIDSSLMATFEASLILYASVSINIIC